MMCGEVEWIFWSDVEERNGFSLSSFSLLHIYYAFYFFYMSICRYLGARELAWRSNA